MKRLFLIALSLSLWAGPADAGGCHKVPVVPRYHPVIVAPKCRPPKPIYRPPVYVAKPFKPCRGHKPPVKPPVVPPSVPMAPVLLDDSEGHGPKGTRHELQLWTPVSIEYPVYKKVYASLWVEPRIGGNMTEFDTLIVRPALGVRFNDHVKAATGYDWVSYYRPDGFENEHRVWEQVELSGHLKRLEVESRHRLEERFLPHTSDVGVRYRSRVRAVLPVGKTRRWYLAAMNELFLNLNDAGPVESGFDRDRIFVGLGKRLNPHTRLEGGYQLEMVNNDYRFGGQDRVNHILMLSLLFNYLEDH